MKKECGNVLDFLTIILTIIAMSILVMVYLECTNLMMKKLEVGQISRKYLLKMETEGYLTEGSKNSLLAELQQAGVRSVDISGTTMVPVSYGDTIVLRIRGAVEGRIIGTGDELWRKGFVSSIFSVEEEKMSTAKN